ncbi:MAG TPA: helix-turn-helix domain-containing protein [Thermomicrobiales bacterium]|jgi:purine catabolism regulator|nr:helix-turn-helix domain-containing protein [Thermomicrobiales bacterium]
MAAEITLADLLAWVPRLRLPAPPDLPAVPDPTGSRNGPPANPLDRELTWAVTVRASSPMLPPLRGGELVLLPRRVLAESGVSLPLLLRELASHQCSGIVLDGVPSGTAPLPLLVTTSVGPEFENEINRLLTQRRGELYRSGTELEHLLSDLANAGSEAPQALLAIAGQLAVPLTIADNQGRVVHSTSPDPSVPAVAPSTRGWVSERLGLDLSDGRSLWVGPVPRAQRALIRLIGERVAAAVDSALLRASQSRPRGPARALALQSLVSGAVSDPVTRASALGLPIDGHFRVALAAAETGIAGLLRSLGPLGTVHDGATLDGMLLGLVEVRPEPTASGGPRGRTATREFRVPYRHGPSALPPAQGWVALSSVVAGVANLSEALREVRFVVALMKQQIVCGSVVRFDSVDDLGAYRLLYRLWGTTDLTRFAAEALGDLPMRDKKGALRKTLLVYLETGGSHVDAAERLGIHRNTLAYRLKQIGLLTGRNPTDADSRLVLHLALLATTLPSVA